MMRRADSHQDEAHSALSSAYQEYSAFPRMRVYYNEPARYCGYLHTCPKACANLNVFWTSISQIIMSHGMML